MRHLEAEDHLVAAGYGQPALGPANRINHLQARVVLGIAFNAGQAHPLPLRLADDHHIYVIDRGRPAYLVGRIVFDNDFDERGRQHAVGSIALEKGAVLVGGIGHVLIEVRGTHAQHIAQLGLPVAAKDQHRRGLPSRFEGRKLGGVQQVAALAQHQGKLVVRGSTVEQDPEETRVAKGQIRKLGADILAQSYSVVPALVRVVEHHQGGEPAQVLGGTGVDITLPRAGKLPSEDVESARQVIA